MRSFTRIALGVLVLSLPGSAAFAVAPPQPEGRMQMRVPFGSITSPDPMPGAETPVGPGGSPFCEGDGISGSRIQAVYGHLSGQPDNYAASVATIRTMAAAMDDAYDMSAGRQGGSAHPRWAFQAGACNLSVLDIELPSGAADDFDLTIAALRTLGLLSRTDRKYIVWIDAEGSDSLIAQAPLDETPSPATNRADGGATEATVAQLTRNGGWDTDGIGGPVIRWGPQHELSHMLGAVNPGAPHSDGSGHCTEEYDAMCNGAGAVCTPLATQKILLDCNADDYFAVNPPAGNYLATHWNTYNSSFLVRTDTPDLPPETTLADGPSGTTDQATAELSFSSNEAGSFECQLDGGGFSGCSSPKAYSALANGNHAFQVRARDGGGNLDATPAERSWTVAGANPGTAPNTTLTKTKVTRKRRKATFEFAGSGGSGPLSFECKLDRAEFEACSSPVKLKRLKRGRHTFAVRAKDSSGAVDPSPATKDFKVRRRRSGHS